MASAQRLRIGDTVQRATGPALGRHVLVALEGGQAAVVCGDCGRLWVHAVLQRYDAAAGELDGDLTIFGEDGRVVVAVRRARLQRVHLDAPAVEAVRKGGPCLAAAELIGAPDAEARLLDYLKAELAFSLQLPQDEIDPGAQLAPQIDSLIAAELNLRVERNLGVRLPVAALFDGCSLADVARLLLAEIRPPEVDHDLLARMLDELDLLSEDEAKTRVASLSGAGA